MHVCVSKRVFVRARVRVRVCVKIKRVFPLCGCIYSLCVYVIQPAQSGLICVFALCVQGPVYVQSVGGVMLLGGFVNYFALANANGLSSALWTSRCVTCVT